MQKNISKKTNRKKAKSQSLSYRLKCQKTANGLSHYVPAEKNALV